jgi:hypothetical protein
MGNQRGRGNDLFFGAADQEACDLGLRWPNTEVLGIFFLLCAGLSESFPLSVMWNSQS